MPNSSEEDFNHLREAAAASREALKIFWIFLNSQYETIQAEMSGVLARLPSYAKVAAMAASIYQDPQVLARRREQQRRAVEDGDWEPYQRFLQGTGRQFAQSGMSFEDCASFFFSQRRLLLRRLRRELPPALREQGEEGLELFLGKATAYIGEGYLQFKQEELLRKEQALRELSTPVLQVGERLLIMPLIGTLDAPRVSQVRTSLLAEVRRHRAQAVVLDVTGVPMVDSDVAASLTHTAAAAELMGCQVILTGMSTETARCLVSLGVNMEKILTHGSLLRGLQVAEEICFKP